jgi:hypothetical protein
VATLAKLPAIGHRGGDCGPGGGHDAGAQSFTPIRQLDSALSEII